MSIQTGLRIRWAPAAQQTADVHGSSSLPPVLTRITHALAQADVSMDAFVGYIAGAADEVHTIICLPTNTLKATDVLRKMGMQVEQVPLVLAWLPDTPVSLACACEVIQTAKVHIDLACLIRVDRGQGQQIAFFCDDAELADRLLWALSY